MSNSQQGLLLLLLGLVPTDQLQPHQKAKWRQNTTWPTYRLLRLPNNVQEFQSYKPGVAIWRDNGTLTYVSSRGKEPTLDQTKKILRLALCFGIMCTIVGECEQAIVETADLFWNLPCTDAGESLTSRHHVLAIAVCNNSSEFNCTMIQPQQLARALQMDPKSPMQLSGLTLNTTQSVALATRPDPVNLVLLNSIRFEDGGSAFVNALQSRTSSFGTLRLSTHKDNSGDQLCFDHAVLKRLFQTKTIERLEIIGAINDHEDLIPVLFSSSIQRIQRYFSKQGYDQEVVVLLPRHVLLKLFWSNQFPRDSIFWDLSHLDHMNAPHLTVHIQSRTLPIPDSIFRELFRFIAAQDNLQSLDWDVELNSVERLEGLLSVVENHKTLHNLRLHVYSLELDPDYSMLVRMLSRNRSIRFPRDLSGTGWLEQFMRAPSSGIISLNRFYRGSASLGRAAQSIRPTLVGTSLIQSASGIFQRSALLLANHTDALCQLLFQGEEEFRSAVESVDCLDSRLLAEESTFSAHDKDDETYQPQRAAKKKRRL